MTDNKEEKLKTFWFYINDDYRSGKSIYAYTKSSKYEEPEEEPDEEPEEEPDNIPYGAIEIKLGLPKEGRRLYIVVGFPHYKSIWQTDIDSHDDNHVKTLYLKIFSQIHNRLPFYVTKYTSAYHEKGYYPHVPDNIKSTPNIIDQELVKKISERQDYGDYFLFVIDKYGNEITTNLLNPI
jgi:hypothetical protein